MPRRVFNCS